MKVYFDALRTQKAGNAYSEYEDAFWPPQTHRSLDQKVVRIAAADGATDGIFSGLWARLLVRSYGRDQLNYQDLPAKLLKLGHVWRKIVKRWPMPWYVEERIRSGAFAAFIGVELTQTDDSALSGVWSALACGDSCFFQLRNGEVLTAFPLSRSEEFSNNPFLLNSSGLATTNIDGVRIASGSWEEGDCLYLMTDALAHWFLASCEQETVPWQILRDIAFAADPPFERWISDLRTHRKLKNDDCTLLSLTFEHC